METPEENLPLEIGQNSLQDESIEQTTPNTRLVKILMKTGAIVVLISVFIFFISVIFMSHTYSYHL
jgi:hypothetical protein